MSNSVDINLIKQRKTQYGDNLQRIADKWNFSLGFTGSDAELDGKEVSKMMALMKQVRIEDVESRILTARTRDYIEETDRAFDLMELKASLKDNQIDFDNYNWIATNFEEYQSL